MAGGKPNPDATEEPSPRRLDEARKQGDVARSADLTSGTALVTAVGVVVATGGGAVARLAGMMRGVTIGAVSATPPQAGAALRDAAETFAALVLPVVGAAAGAALAVGMLQTRGMVAMRLVAPDLTRVNPLAGLARMASMDALVALARAAVKALIVAAIAWWTVRPLVGDTLRLGTVGASRALAVTAGVAGTLLLRVAVATFVVGVLDLLWQRRQFRARHRMTKDEVKREHRESEGDPRHKAERRRAHRELSEARAIRAVAEATCVIVNPDHLAVALRWDEATMTAPEIVVKGQELVAEEIKAIARAHGVPIYRDVGLARALTALDEGAAIPEELYEAVAEVLELLAEERAR